MGRPIHVWVCHTKIGPAGPILAKKLVESGPRTTFAAKIGPAGPILAAIFGYPCQL